MISAPRKAKQFFTANIKLLVVGGAFYSIYLQTINRNITWNVFGDQFQLPWSILSLVAVSLFSIGNKYFEVIKWKKLVSTIRPISTSEAWAQILGAATAGIGTPAALGDYAAKMFFFEKKYSKRIIFINFLSNATQMLATILFGSIGLLYLYNAEVFGKQHIFGIIAILLFGIFLYKALKLGFLRFQKNIIRKLMRIPKMIYVDITWLSLLRFVIFSHQYYFLLLILGVDLHYIDLLSAICATYFVSSLLPSFQIVDFAIKGSVGILFFGVLGINEWIVVLTSSIMWLLNVVIPAIIGSYFMVNINLKWK